MFKKSISSLAVVGTLALLACQSAMSSPLILSGFSEHNETRAYVGLQWFMGETSVTKPNLVLGLRNTTTNISNEVAGFDMSFAYSLEKSKADALRLGYVGGKCTSLGTVGVGYSFKNDALLGFVGVVGSNAKLFGEMDANKQMGLGLELNTLPCAGDRETTQNFPT